MTRSEYQELVEFLGERFSKIDQRLEAVEQRAVRAEVLGEENRAQMRILAEAIAALDEKFERFRDEVAAEFRAVRTEMDARFAAAEAERQAGFASIRLEMAEEFKNLRQEMKDGFEAQALLIQGLGLRVERLEA